MSHIHDCDAQSVLLTEEQIRTRVDELGEEITRDYQGKELLVVGILKGAVIFYADLVRKINMPMEFDFMVVSSYGNSTKSSGVVRIIKDLSQDITGKHVLIIEDILDTGLTLNYLTGILRHRNPASIEICTLMDKPERRKVDLKAKYTGFLIPDAFVIGYGLDYDEKYRNMPYVGILKPEIYSK
jgi:hypoxanthine phosphoribosyltransferase